MTLSLNTPRIITVLAGLFALGMPYAPVFAQSPQDQRLELLPVRDNIYVIKGFGGNIGVSIGDDGVMLIDDQFAPVTPQLLSLVGTLSDQPVRFVINTHWHGDHTGGNEALGKAGAILVAHDNVRKHMSVDWFYEMFNETVPASSAEALQRITFSQELTFHMNNDEARIIHLPHAHTDGDSAVYFKNSNVLHMGDAFIQEGFPLIDWSSGGSIDGMIAAFKRARALINKDTLIIPGHGPIATYQELEATIDYISTIRDRIQTMIEAGKTVDEIISANPTAEWNETHTNPFVTGESLTRAIHHTLTMAPHIHD